MGATRRLGARPVGETRSGPALAPAALEPAWYETMPPSHFWMRWRLAVLRRRLRGLGLHERAPLAVLDIGCGHGAVLERLEAVTAWTVDGCDVNPEALARCRPGRGRTLLYDASERREGLVGRYDLVLLLDVLEHVAEPRALLAAALAHAKPGGLVVVNVPALPALRSAFDDGVGHLRRYDPAGLVALFSEGGARCVAWGYWGLALVPALAARRMWLGRRLADGAAAADVVRRGLAPPGLVTDRLLRLAMRVELAWPWKLPLGSSLLLVARREPEVVQRIPPRLGSPGGK